MKWLLEEWEYKYLEGAKDVWCKLGPCQFFLGTDYQSAPSEERSSGTFGYGPLS